MLCCTPGFETSFKITTEITPHPDTRQAKQRTLNPFMPLSCLFLKKTHTVIRMFCSVLPVSDAEACFPCWRVLRQTLKRAAP
jgi:hypothetical protein